MKSRHLFFAASLFLVAWADCLSAVGPDDLFFWNVTISKKTVAPGELVLVTAEVLITPKHYVYREYAKFEVSTDPEIQVGQTIYPKGEPYHDTIEDREIEVYKEHAAFGIPIWIPPDMPEGTYSIQVKYEFQGCSDTTCYRKKVDVPAFQVKVSGAPLEGAKPPPEFRPVRTGPEGKLPPLVTYGGSGRLARLLEEGLFRTFLAIFLAGILTSFTPCVYPLIPVTVSIFGARKAKSRWSSFFLSLTYVLGIAVMYSALGLAAASAGVVFGSIMANPVVIGIVAAFFIAMGLSMVGVFAFQLPSGLMTRASQVRGAGHAGAFGMGLVSGVIAAPCTGPILAGILAYVATTGNLFLGFWLLFTYAVGIGVLFLLIGTFSGLAGSLPKSGGWMETLKAVFAVVLFGMALYFLRTVIPPLDSILGNSAAYYVGVFVLLGLAYVLGAFKGFHGRLSPVKKVCRPAGLVLASLAVYLFAGSFTVVPEPAVEWRRNDVLRRLEEARIEGRPALVDFYADWCAYCVKLDKETFSNPRVGEALEKFVIIKADFTESGTEEEDVLRRRYDIHGLPVLLFFDSEGNLIEGKRREGFVGPEDMIELAADIS